MPTLLQAASKSTFEPNLFGGSAMNYMTRYPIGTKRRTGEICPESGVWKVEYGTKTIPLAKGNVFPPADNRAVTWVLTQYA